MSVSPTVVLRDVRFGFGATPILDGVDLELVAGEFVVLAGANGSGKSTLLRLCVGLLEPTGGEIRVLGGSPRDRSVLRRIGYAPQGLRMATAIPVSVTEVVSAGVLGRATDGGRAVADAIAAVGLTDLAAECLFELSGGQQQRAILARALVGDPDLILLDEPTTGIDQTLRPAIAAGLRARADAGATVVAVSHDPEDFHQVCDRILVVGSGAVRPITHGEFHDRAEGVR